MKDKIIRWGGIGLGIIIFGIFFILLISAATQEFYEDCSGGNLATQWIVGDWAEGSGGDAGRCWITETGTMKNMTSNTIDLSSGDIAYANLTFDTDHIGFNGNDYFYVWIKNTDTTILLLESIDDSILSFSFNLSEYITLDANVQIIGGCLTIGKNDDCRWDNINITSYPVPAGDTCTYTSGNWAVDCSDYCNITSLVNMEGNNLSIIGTGTFKMTSDISNFGTVIVEGTDSDNKCIVICDGGCFKD